MTAWLRRMVGVDALRGEATELKEDMEALRARVDERLARLARQQDDAIADIKAHLASFAAEQSERAARLDQLAGTLEEMRRRIEAVEDDANASSGASDRANDSIGVLKAALARQEQQLRLHTEESAKIWAALVERVELARLAGGRSSVDQKRNAPRNMSG